MHIKQNHYLEFQHNSCEDQASFYVNHKIKGSDTVSSSLDSACKTPIKHLRSSLGGSYDWRNNDYDDNTTNEGCSIETKSDNSTHFAEAVKKPIKSRNFKNNIISHHEDNWKPKQKKYSKQSCYPRTKNYDNLYQLLLSAVHELYRDQLRPTFPELRRRLRKYKLSASIFKNLAETYKQLSDDVIVDTEKQEVLLKNRKDDHVIDPKSPHDTFSCCDWSAFQKYVLTIIKAGSNALNQVNYTFEGGRYGMASKMLQDPLLQSERLSSMSIGALCHLIQLSIAYGIMQYENNILRPRATCLRIGAAYAQSDLNIYNASSNAFMALEKVKVALKKILKDYPNAMLLSQLKLAFENKVGLRFICVLKCHMSDGQQDYAKACLVIRDNYSRIFIQSVEYPIPPNMSILNYDNANTEFPSDEKARRTISISFLEDRRCCCRPLPYLISYHAWEKHVKGKVIKTVIENGSTIELGFDASRHHQQVFPYSGIVESVMTYLDL